MARGLLEQQLGGSLSRAELDDAKSVVSELANNAYLHGLGRIDLSITQLRDRVRIEVSDQGDGVSLRLGDSATGVPQSGLEIVRELSLAWGWSKGTTHVWAEVPRSDAVRA